MTKFEQNNVETFRRSSFHGTCFRYWVRSLCHSYNHENERPSYKLVKFIGICNLISSYINHTLWKKLQLLIKKTINCLSATVAFLAVGIKYRFFTVPATLLHCLELIFNSLPYCFSKINFNCQIYSENDNTSLVYWFVDLEFQKACLE